MKKQSVIWLSLLIVHFSISIYAQVKPYKQEGKVRVNSLTLAYEMFGTKGEVILLINGTGSQLTDWPVELCEKLSQNNYRVIRFDNRDVGLSSKLDSLGAPDWSSIFPKIKTCDMSTLQYTIYDMAKDAVGLLDALKIEKAHIVGISMGGAIAQYVAINFPERTLSLTSISASSGNPDLPPGNPEVLAIMGTPPPATEKVDEQALYLLNIYKAMGSKTYPPADSVLMQIALNNAKRSWYPAGTARHAAAIIIGDCCDRREKLKNIRVPVLVIHGEADPVVNIAAGREVAATIPGAKLITIPGMGHVIPFSLIDQIVDGIIMIIK